MIDVTTSIAGNLRVNRSRSSRYTEFLTREISTSIEGEHTQGLGLEGRIVN